MYIYQVKSVHRMSEYLPEAIFVYTPGEEWITTDE